MRERYSDTNPYYTLCSERISKCCHPRKGRLVSNCILASKINPLDTVDNCWMLKSTFAAGLHLDRSPKMQKAVDFTVNVAHTNG